MVNRKYPNIPAPLDYCCKPCYCYSFSLVQVLKKLSMDAKIMIFRCKKQITGKYKVVGDGKNTVNYI